MNRLGGRRSDRGSNRRYRRGSALLRFLLLHGCRRREWLRGLLWGWLLFSYRRFNGRGLNGISTKTQTSKLHAYFVKARGETSRQRHDNSLINALVLATNSRARRKRYRRFGPSGSILLLNLGWKSRHDGHRLGCGSSRLLLYSGRLWCWVWFQRRRRLRRIPSVCRRLMLNLRLKMRLIIPFRGLNSRRILPTFRYWFCIAINSWWKGSVFEDWFGCRADDWWGRWCRW